MPFKRTRFQNCKRLIWFKTRLTMTKLHILVKTLINKFNKNLLIINCV